LIKLIPLLLSFFLLGTACASTKLSLVAIGHLYPLFESGDDDFKKELLLALFDKVNSLNPNFVAILGDSSLDEAGRVEFFRTHIKPEVLFAPGNNDLDTKDGGQYEAVKDRKKRYLSRVGYLDKVINRNGVRLVIFNSQESSQYLNAFFNRVLRSDRDLNEPSTTMLLGHHRIWDDTNLSAEPYQHDKSYYFDEIFDALAGRVDAIFAGNSKRQYFTDFEGLHGPVHPKWGKQNVNNIFWADKIGEIAAYSIGTAEGIPKLGFVEIKVLESGEILINPHFVSVGYKDPIPRNFVVPDGTTHPRESGKHRLLMGIATGLSVALISILTLFLIRRWFRTR